MKHCLLFSHFFLSCFWNRKQMFPYEMWMEWQPCIWGNLRPFISKKKYCAEFFCSSFLLSAHIYISAVVIMVILSVVNYWWTLVLMSTWLMEMEGILIHQKRLIQIRTPLHLAAISGSDLCVHLLLEKGAKVHLLDNQNRTPITLASESNH